MVAVNLLSSRANMRTRLLYLLVLLAYVNTVFYQGNPVRGTNSAGIIDGAPLVEIILADVLNIIPDGGDTKPDDVQYDDYRPSTAKCISTPLPKKNTSIDFAPILAFCKPLTYWDFDTRISCLLGYYLFLFRLKPF
ncbi:hypothetical protein [Parapedobacter lycopersici]|uniref:hypothetical protein n=1 Tax=Parapedobacter lycopersici TaxID=1864939 RepID=UPI00214D99B0|nr:hypothetical protein [Parapedobacter lycopersici]